MRLPSGGSRSRAAPNENNNDHGLAVAQPVDDSDGLDLPQAEAELRQPPKTGIHSNWKHLLCISVLVITPIVVLLIAFVQKMHFH